VNWLKDMTTTLLNAVIFPGQHQNEMKMWLMFAYVVLLSGEIMVITSFSSGRFG